MTTTIGNGSAMRTVCHYSYVGILELEPGPVCPSRHRDYKSAYENDGNLWFTRWIASNGKFIKINQQE